MGGSGKNEKEVWYTLARLSSTSLVCGHNRPAGSADERQVRIRSGAIAAWG